jgi:hypothetical protein
MKYRFKATETFWKSFHALTSNQKEAARRAWAVFKESPFDPRLRTHKIHRLSAHYAARFTRWTSKATSVRFIDGDCVLTVDIGTHELYKT